MLPSFATLFTGFRNVFVFAHDLSFPCGYFFFGFNGKMTKVNKMAKNHFSRVQNGSQSVSVGVLGGEFVLKSGLRILNWAPQVPFSVPPKRPKWVFLAILGVPKVALRVTESKF